MEIRQLECFIAVAEERHFTRAAQRLNIVQSALSQTIRTLEAELGGPLLSRSTRRVDLTPAGKVLLHEARRVLAATREARLAVTEVHGLARGQLRVGAIQSLAPFVDLPASLGRFREALLGIDIELRIDGAAPLLDEVNAGRLDIAFTQPSDIGAGMTTQMLACEDMLLICAPHHPLLAGPPPTLSDLLAYPFVDVKAEWGMRREVDRHCAHCGAIRTVSFEVDDIPMLTDLVAQNLGIALLPESLARAREKDSKGRPIIAVALAEGATPCWELIVAFKGQNGQAADRITRTFLDLLVSSAGVATHREV